MCLDNPGKLRTAKKDIIVYKVIAHCGKNYKTYYRQARVKIGETYKSPLQLNFHWTNTIERGLHSYASPGAAENYARVYSLVVAECTIPAGASYYKGKFGFNAAYASNQLRYDKIIIDYSLPKKK